MNRKLFYLLLAVLSILLCRVKLADAYTVTDYWTSAEGWGAETTNFDSNTDSVYINVDADNIPEPISGLWMQMQWYKPNGEREYDLGTNLIAHPVYTETGLLTGFWAEMVIKGMDREPGLWRVEHYAYGYLDDVLDWHRLFTAYFTIDATTTWTSAYRTMFSNQSDLGLLRQYRDEFLTKITLGKLYTELLYKSSEEALEVLLDNPRLMARARRLIEANRDAVAEVLDGNRGVIYNTDEIISFLDAYAQESPASLKLLAITVKKEMIEKQEQGEPFLGFELH